MQFSTLMLTSDLPLPNNMKNKIKKRRRLIRLIRECEEEMQNISTLPYYTIFNKEAERTADLTVLQHRLTALKAKQSKINS